MCRPSPEEQVVVAAASDLNGVRSHYPPGVLVVLMESRVLAWEEMTQVATLAKPEADAAALERRALTRKSASKSTDQVMSYR